MMKNQNKKFIKKLNKLIREYEDVIGYDIISELDEIVRDLEQVEEDRLQAEDRARREAEYEAALVRLDLKTQEEKRQVEMVSLPDDPVELVPGELHIVEGMFGHRAVIPSQTATVSNSRQSVTLNSPYRIYHYPETSTITVDDADTFITVLSYETSGNALDGSVTKP